jgi:hypothetical protein
LPSGGGPKLHYGSGSDLLDYETTTASLYVSGSIYPDERWTLSFNGSYTMAKAEFSPIDLDLPETTLAHGEYDWSDVNTYSDLEYNVLEVSARGSHMIADDSSVYLGVGLSDLSDDQPYVYGDLSGSVIFVESGIQVGF